MTKNILLIIKESSSVFWAIYNKIPIIVPSLYSIIDLCPLSGITNLAIYVKDSQELFTIVNNIMDNKENIVKEDRYQDFLNQYLEIYPEERQYYENLIGAIRQNEQ